MYTLQLHKETRLIHNYHILLTIIMNFVRPFFSHPCSHLDIIIWSRIHHCANRLLEFGQTWQTCHSDGYVNQYFMSAGLCFLNDFLPSIGVSNNYSSCLFQTRVWWPNIGRSCPVMHPWWLPDRHRLCRICNTPVSPIYIYFILFGCVYLYQRRIVCIWTVFVLNIVRD